MTDSVSALGAPVRYSVHTVQSGCVYNVVVRKSSDNTLAGSQLVVTDSNGDATAMFSALPVGIYTISATSPNCGGCAPPARTVQVVPGSQNVCNPCCGSGVGGACNGVVGISPTTFVAGVETAVAYTLTGVPNCRVKLLAYNGSAPIIDSGTGNPIFTYVTNGVANNQFNTWPVESIGAPINWRVAPMEEQDACLQGCTITPQQIALTVTASSGECAVTWAISPPDPVLGLAVAGHFYAYGMSSGCVLKVQAFQSDGTTPVIVGGNPIYVDIPNAGVSFETLSAVAGDTTVWKPAAAGLQQPCLAGCTITPSAIVVTVRAAENPGTCGLTLVSQTCTTPGVSETITFGGLIVGRNYQLRWVDEALLGTPISSWSSGGAPVAAFTTTSVVNNVAGRRYVLVDYFNQDCVSPVTAHFACDLTPPGTSWWCLSSSCVPATSQPGGSAGPFASQVACEAVCSAPPGVTSIAMGDDFSPPPPPCSVLTGEVMVQGVYKSYTFVISGTTPSSVTVTGIPAGMNRVNGAGTIVVSGVPTGTGAFSISAFHGGCTMTVSGTISASCNITWSVAPSVIAPGSSAVWTVNGPPGCAVVFGYYDEFDDPIIFGGVHIKYTAYLNGAGASSVVLGACTTPGFLRFRPMTGTDQSLCARFCTFSPAYQDLTCAA